MPEFSGSPRGDGRRIVVVASRFNEGVTLPLAEGAVAALVRQGVAFEDIDVLWVPGAWELPVAVRRALDRKSTRLNSSHVTTSRMPSSA